MSRIPALVLSCLCLILWSVPAAATLTQRQWMHDLVDAMGWSYGLPDQPEDADYRAILDGNRTFRFEAETIFDKKDIVSVSKLRNFGPFGGSAWLEGISTPTPVQLQFLLPLAGTYRLRVNLRGAEHRFRIGKEQITVEGKNHWSLVDLGTHPFAAGPQQIEDLLPPDGGLDAIELDAPPWPAIRPRDGWRPEAALTTTDLAVTSLRLLGIEDALPATDRTLTIEAEGATALGTAQIVSQRFLGSPSGDRWVRAGAAPATVTLDFEVGEAAVYQLSLRALGPGQITALLDGHERFALAGKAFLADVALGAHYLSAGKHRLEVHLPVRGGIDALRLAALDSTPTACRRLAGLPAGADPTPEQIDRLLQLLAAIGSDR